MRKAQGFTLIELILVSVILAILTIVSISKFIALSSEARIASLEAMRGSLMSGTSLIYIRSVLDGQTEGNGSITVDGLNITVHSGFPTGHWRDSMRYIVGLDDVVFTASKTQACDVEWCGKGNQASLPSGVRTTRPVIIGKVYPNGYSFNDECGVYFINYLDGNRPEIMLEIKDC